MKAKRRSADNYQKTPLSQRLLIGICGIPGSGKIRQKHTTADLENKVLTVRRFLCKGKTTLAALVSSRLNGLHHQHYPGVATQIASFIPMDGYHLTRAQLSAMPNPAQAHARRGAAFTFDGASFLELVHQLRAPLAPESKTIYAPSFDHAIKDPVANDIAVPPSARIVVFEGNYLGLNRPPWSEAGSLMDELWYVKVDFDVARRRLVERHVKAGIVKSVQEAERRVEENDLVNGQEIVQGLVDTVKEVVVSIEDESWGPEAQGVGK